jgi:hypothetical protein
MRQAFHQAEADRIGARRHDYGNRARGFRDRQIGWHRRGDDDVWTEPDQFCGQGRKPLEVAVGESVLEANIAAFYVAEVAQAVAKRVDLLLQDCGGSGVKEADERR